jgi:hypothetical protein
MPSALLMLPLSLIIRKEALIALPMMPLADAGARIRHDVADLDFRVGDAGVVFLLRGSWRRGCGDDLAESARALASALMKFVLKKSLSERFMSFLLP